MKLTDRQRQMVLAMFVGNEIDGDYTDDEIRELVALMWEWQWGVGRALLECDERSRRSTGGRVRGDAFWM